MENLDPYTNNTVYVPPVPNVDEPPEDADPLITSVFMKVSRAVDGDSHYKNRVNIALEMYGLPQTRSNLIHVTKEVADSILCWVSGRVDTSNVTDEQIILAMEESPDKF